MLPRVHQCTEVTGHPSSRAACAALIFRRARCRANAADHCARAAEEEIAMVDRITDSNAGGQAPSLRNSDAAARYAPNMPRPPSTARDPGLSEYVRMRVREWVASGRQLLELAALAGVSQSTPSQILTGLGVGPKTAPGWARALGFASADDLTATAYRWWLDRSAVALTDAQREAITAATGLGQLTEAQAQAIAAAFGNPRTRDRDVHWWLALLLSEAAIDRAALDASERARARQAEHRAVRRKATRAAHVEPAVPPLPARRPA